MFSMRGGERTQRRTLVFEWEHDDKKKNQQNSRKCKFENKKFAKMQIATCA